MLVNRFITILIVYISANIQHIHATEYTISGIIQEEETESPIAYATVAVYDETDASLLTGVISNEDGKFEITINKQGNYYLQINVLGFGEHIIHNILLSDINPNINIGTIYIEPELTNLEEVVVTGEKATIEYKVDRKVIDINKLGILNNVPLSEALEILPSVETDNDGNVSLRGSRNFQVLIDGKPSALSGSEALQQYTSSQIEKIEVITNPSAKYDANNTSGIINLILKKGEGFGFSGLVNFGAAKGIGKSQPYNISATLSYKQKKYSLTGAFNFNKQQFEMDWIRRQRRENGANLDRFSSNNVPMLIERVSLDFDYFVNSRHTVTLAGRIMKNDYKFDIQTENHLLEPDAIPFFSRVKGILERHGLAVTLFDQLKIDEEGHELKTLASYYRQLRDEPRMFWEYLTLNKENANLNTEFETFSSHNQFQFNTDYTKPLSENGTLEMGVSLQTISRNSSRGEETFLPIALPKIENQFTLKNNTYAAYITHKNKFKSIDVQGGMRLEYYNHLIRHKKSGTLNDYKKLNVFPSIHLSKKINDKQEVSISYTKRIRRPTMFELQPYLDWGDNYFSYGGNPNLTPANINATELAYTYSFNKVTVTVESYYRHTNREITRGERLNSETGIIEAMPVNIDNSIVYGVEPSFNITAANWLKIIISGAYFKNKITGVLFDNNIDKNYNGWRMRLNNTINLPKNIKLNFNGYYNSKVFDAQGETNSNYRLDLFLSTTFLNKKGTVSVSFIDIFDTKRLYRINRDNGFTNTLLFKLPGRQVIGVNLSYKFNNYKKKENKFELED